MMDFKLFLEERATVKAPQGVIFFGDNGCIVGIKHHRKLVLSKDLIEKIKQIGNKRGYWYEGVGGDNQNIEETLGNIKFKGSWDDLLAKEIDGYPYYFLYVLFSNTKVNNQKSLIMNSKGKTIFEKIINGQSLYFKDRRFDEATLKKFLRECSDEENDFVKMADQQATDQSVANFLAKGEQRMWPKNWKQWPNPAGKVAKKATEKRDQFLIAKAKTGGVYFTGAGHLLDLIALDKSLKMVGGELVQ